MLTKRTLLASLFTCRFLINPDENVELTKECTEYITTLGHVEITPAVVEKIYNHQPCTDAVDNTLNRIINIPFSINQHKHLHQIGSYCLALRQIGYKDLEIKELPLFLLYSANLMNLNPSLYVWKKDKNGLSKSGYVSIADDIKMKLTLKPILNAQAAKEGDEERQEVFVTTQSTDDSTNEL